MVTIDHGEFKLMRNINIEHQPSRSKVESAWIRAFSYNTKDALDHLEDVLEDIFAYRLWEYSYMETPKEYLNYIGIQIEYLQEKADKAKSTIKEYSKPGKQNVYRNKYIKEQIEAGKTQQQVADEVGISRNRISEIVSEKSVYTPKTDTKRKTVQYKISQYTTPETAAQKIRGTFGDEFALALGTLLVS